MHIHVLLDDSVDRWINHKYFDPLWKPLAGPEIGRPSTTFVLLFVCYNNENNIQFEAFLAQGTGARRSIGTYGTMFSQSVIMSQGGFTQKRYTTARQRIWPSCGNYDQMIRSQHGPTVKIVMLELPEERNL